MSELEPTLTNSNLTVTERLRAMLDEREEVWGANDTYRLLVTSWEDTSGHSWAFMEHRDGSFSKLTAYHLTPEQAIAATLGSCNCTNNCTNSERTETCELHDCEGSFSAVNRPVWRCDCGAFMTQYTDATTYHKPRFCPNCGRRIEQ